MVFIKVILTALLSVVMIFVITKIEGQKQLSEIDIFDFISSITVGSIAAELATELDKPLYPMIALAIWFIVTLTISYIEAKLPRARNFLSGVPIILFYDGELNYKNMKKSKLDLNQFLMMCRQAGYFDLASIRMAVFETNGKVSFLPTEQARPVNPCDMQMSPDRDDRFFEIIMDGQIIEEALESNGLNEVWLRKQLSANGLKSEKEVFLGVIDTNKNATFYKY